MVGSLSERVEWLGNRVSSWLDTIVGGGVSNDPLVFALAMGATRDDLASAKPAPAVRRFVDFLMRTARTGLFLDGLLPIYCNESQTYGAADHLYRYLKDQYSLGERELEWFAEHGTADKGHANRGREILAKYLPHYPEFGRRALDLAKESVVEWLALHEYYYSVL